ncbi:hypothetical protein [Streptomyces niveus]|uniref:hypothetical protein n=1 Tax=Streptomyces niveus TaxID=193462 RepID=UPI0036BF7CE7
MDQVTERQINFLHWDRRGFLLSCAQFPAGTPRYRITSWREAVAANGGATVEVYAPAPADVSEARRAYLEGRMAVARAARLARG